MESSVEDNSWKEVSDDNSNSSKIVSGNDKPEVVSQNGQVSLTSLVLYNWLLYLYFYIYIYKWKNYRNNCTLAPLYFLLYLTKCFLKTLPGHYLLQYVLNTSSVKVNLILWMKIGKILQRRWHFNTLSCCIYFWRESRNWVISSTPGSYSGR